MKIVKRKFNRIWILPFLLLFTAHCGSADTALEPAEVEPATLTIVTFETGGAWGNAEEETINRFQEAYPQIEIEREAYSQFPRGYLTSSEPPDIMANGLNYFLFEAITNEQLVDLTDVWIESGLMENYPAGFRVLSEHDGKQYYIPIGYTWSAIYYNKAIFNQYNLEPPRTWDEFILICDTLLANGVTPLSISGDNTWMGMMWFSYLNLRLNGADFHRDLMRGQARYDDPRVRTVLETWRSLIDQGYFVENPTILGDLESLTAIIRGDEGQLHGQKAVMALASPGWIDDLPEKFQAELDFFPFPILDPSVPLGEVLGSYGYMVPRGGENIPQALALLSYMSSAEAQTALVQYSGGAVTYAPANAAVDQNLLSPEVQQGMELVQGAGSLVPNFMLGIPNTMWAEISIGFDRFLRDSGDIDRFIAALEEARQKAEESGLFSAIP